MLNRLNELLSSLIPQTRDDDRPEHTLQLATAVLLIEVMRSDADNAEEERQAILRILKREFRLAEGEVDQLSALAQNTAKEASDLYQFTSLLNRELDAAEKVRIVEYLWQVAYADGRISAHENHLMRRLADLLHIPHGDYIAAKMRAKPADLK